jgi:hypothetical protein
MRQGMVDLAETQIQDQPTSGNDVSWWGNIDTVREIRRSNVHLVEIL